MSVLEEISPLHTGVMPMSCDIAFPASAAATDAKMNPSMKNPPPVARVRRRRKFLPRRSPPAAFREFWIVILIGGLLSLIVPVLAAPGSVARVRDGLPGWEPGNCGAVAGRAAARPACTGVPW